MVTRYNLINLSRFLFIVVYYFNRISSRMTNYIKIITLNYSVLNVSIIC